MFVLYQQERGIWRRVLSHGVTFSNQLVGLLTAYSFFTLVGYERVVKPVQAVLMAYTLLMCVVFYGVIAPLNGVPLSELDHLIHGVIPGMFASAYAIEKERDARLVEHRLVVYLYPAYYYAFAMFISFRRGYWIYPFLGDVRFVGALVLAVELCRQAICRWG